MGAAVFVAAGGALGSLLRYYLNLAVTAWLGGEMPWGTIGINIAGSFLIGLFTGLLEGSGKLPAGQSAQLFLVVGVCGGFTTFSSFSLQTLQLLQGGHPGLALLNVVGSVSLCLLAVAVGYGVA